MKTIIKQQINGTIKILLMTTTLLIFSFFTSCSSNTSIDDGSSSTDDDSSSTDDDSSSTDDDSSSTDTTSDDSDSLTGDQLINFLSEKADYLATTILDNNNRNFVCYTDTSGNWELESSDNWGSGFNAGIFWYLYAMTEDEKWKDYGDFWNSGLESRQTATDNDTGFQIFDSFGLAYQFTTDNSADNKQVIFTAADTLTNQRYNSTIGAYRAWPQEEDDPDNMPFEINVDMIMNMEIVLWAAANGGTSAYEDYAINHADTTWDQLVRDDGSSYHVVTYESADDASPTNRTHQGWQTDSTWSRGQSWLVYGFAMLYRYTGLTRMLDRSIACYDYFVEATAAQRSDYVPYSDFDAPIDSENPRDTAATAVVASGALELYTITGETKYRDYAENSIKSLVSEEYLSYKKNYESLLLNSSEKWGETEVGAVFGDYFFVELLYRWREWVANDPAENKPDYLLSNLY